MFTNEKTATRKIAKILSRLDSEAAARVAKAAAEQFALRPAATPPEAPGPAHGDNRPSFLQTQHRMQFGKELLEKLEKEGS
ncbi:MAG: hypothetical protein PVJ49_03010 [Acidobacteriota bacterium]|jgi:hypothetical protein